MKKSLLLISILLLASCEDGAGVEEFVLMGLDTKVASPLGRSTKLKAKNVILFIGDGMGPNQVSLARLSIGGSEHRLSFQNFPITGIVYNHLLKVYPQILRQRQQLGRPASKQSTVFFP